jgi:hypothetical protein
MEEKKEMIMYRSTVRQAHAYCTEPFRPNCSQPASLFFSRVNSAQLPATSQSAVFFSHNKSASATSHQPTFKIPNFYTLSVTSIFRRMHGALNIG